MQAQRLPPQRQPAHVYRRRQAVAASVVLLVVLFVARLVSGGGGGDEEPVQAVAAETTTTTTPAAPPCREGDLPVAQDPINEWDSVIVDTERALSATFGPTDLVNVAEAGFPLGAAVRRIVLEDLRELREAAEANGTPLAVLAGYRSYQQQADLFARRIDQMGEIETRSRVAQPGNSEHQLGTAIDVADEGATDVDQSWATTPAGQWVAGNAHKYGFILSYPQAASERTCFDFEPWHLRYVGRERAAQVIASGRTLREVLYAIERDGAPPTTAVPGSSSSTTVVDADDT
jgi:zinc D-Ala-D-Ala carboxypeptidase